MLPRESRYPRGQRRARRQTDVSALESLEERALLSFTTLGNSLPDLTISGEAGPRAAWGGTIDVSAFLQNIGASTTTEPLSQLPPTQPQAAGSLYGSTSSADAPDSTVAVLLTKSPKSLKGAVTLGTFVAPPLTQNSVEQLSDAFTLPSRPKGFAGAGGKFYVWFVANSTGAFPEANHGKQREQAGRGSGGEPAITGAACHRAGCSLPDASRRYDRPDHRAREPRHGRFRAGHRRTGRVAHQELHSGQLDHRDLYRLQRARGFRVAHQRELQDVRQANPQSSRKTSSASLAA